jgi:hypothetical protein
LFTKNVIAYDAIVVTLRWFGTYCLALMIGLNPIAAPEHVHESEDHRTLRAHRHLHGHFGDTHHAEYRDDDIIDGDDPLFTFQTDIALVSPMRSLAARAVESPVLLLDPPAAPVLSHGTAHHVEPLSHSPPRSPAGLRAPPSASRL